MKFQNRTDAQLDALIEGLLNSDQPSIYNEALLIQALSERRERRAIAEGSLKVTRLPVDDQG